MIAVCFLCSREILPFAIFRRNSYACNMHRSILCFDDTVHRTSSFARTLLRIIYLSKYIAPYNVRSSFIMVAMNIESGIWNARTSMTLSHTTKNKIHFFFRFCSFKNDRRLGNGLNVYDTFNCIMAMAMCTAIVMIVIHKHNNDTHRFLGTVKTFLSCMHTSRE